jgi:hypothetical protein
MSLFEAIMLICFGVSWPLSIYKSYKSRQTGGKSVVFLYLILIGYVAGIINKILNGADFVTFLYVLNGLMVSTDIILYYRNRKIEAINTKKIK